MKSSFYREGYLSLYLLLLPSLVFLFIFHYIPLNGVVMAFQDYNIFQGMMKSEFIGFENFQRAFRDLDFLRAVRNTLVINGIKTVFYTVLPVVISVLLTEVGSLLTRRFIQTVIYLPHFLSWVIVAGIFMSLLSVNGGIVNIAIKAVGAPPVRFMFDNRYFRWVIVFSAMWKEAGWGTVIYLAAIAAVDPQLYEAAIIDGATRIKQAWYITIPSIAGTIVIVTLMSLGSILSRSFEQVFVMYNPVVYETADIINTYVYRMGLGQFDYSYAIAIGLFNGLVGLILVLSTNRAAKSLFGRSLW